MDTEEENGSAANRQEHLLELLENLHNNPININLAAKSDLLALPFLQENQVDSILKYRRQKHLFRSLGELQFIECIPYETRKKLSLFVFAGDTIRKEEGLQKKLFSGKHEITTRSDFPLYKRSGQNSSSDQPKAYQGSGIANVVRYRYHYGQNIKYGITLQKDAGEAMFNRKGILYDYSSFYFHYKSSQNRFSYWMGDYNILWGQGLIMGNTFFSGRLQVIENALRGDKEIRPHTSTDESNFLRGLAGRLQISKHWKLAAFASYRKLDARVKDGVVTSLKTDGFHRTETERNNRNTLSNITSGGSISYQKNRWKMGVNAFYTWYDKRISPEERFYNKYYFRGQQTWGWSTDYMMTDKNWEFKGETAFDKDMNIATSNTLKYLASASASFTAQIRYFSPKFASPFSNTLQAGSRVQNEMGVLLGTRILLSGRTEFTGYADLFKHPRPTYRARKTSMGMECFLQCKIQQNNRWQWLTRYRIKTKQQDIAGYQGHLEYATTHKGRLSCTYTAQSWSIQNSFDICAACKQTAPTSLGWMLSTRGSCRFSPAWSTALFASVFFTDDYASRLYAYEPQLQYAAGFPTFAYHGTRIAVVTNWKVCKQFSLGFRYSLTHYFDRDEIGSSTQCINSSSQNDISLQIKLTL